MNYNPYAAPQAPPAPPPPGGPGFSGTPQPWDIGEVLGAAAESFKANAGVLIGSMFVFGLLILPLGGLPSALTLTHAVRPGMGSSFLSLACTIANMVIQAFLTTGLLRIFLAVARGQQASVADLFSGGSLFLPMLGITVLTFLITILGCGCLGLIVLYMGLNFGQYFVVDQNMGPIDALRAAWRVVDGQRGQVLLYGVVALLLTMAGLVLCGVGVLVTAPIATLGFTIIYLRLTGRGVAPAGGGSGWGGAPPGGYGPPPGGGYGPAGGGGYGGPGGGYGPPPGGGGYGPPGGGYGGPPQGGGGYGGPGGGYGGPGGGGRPGY